MNAKCERANMRAYAHMYRANLQFARRYKYYHPEVYERWCVKAGVDLCRAMDARDNAHAAKKAQRIAA